MNIEYVKLEQGMSNVEGKEKRRRKDEEKMNVEGKVEPGLPCQ